MEIVWNFYGATRKERAINTPVNGSAHGGRLGVTLGWQSCLATRVALHQRRLMGQRWEASGFCEPVNQPSLATERASDVHNRGLKPPGYRHIPLRGWGPVGAGRKLSDPSRDLPPRKALSETRQPAFITPCERLELQE
jgi:hypothetical protein